MCFRGNSDGGRPHWRCTSSVRSRASLAAALSPLPSPASVRPSPLPVSPCGWPGYLSSIPGSWGTALPVPRPDPDKGSLETCWACAR